VYSIGKRLSAYPHDRLTASSGPIGIHPLSLRTEIVRYEAAAKAAAVIVRALVQQVAVEPDDPTGRHGHGYAFSVVDVPRQTKFALLRSF